MGAPLVKTRHPGVFKRGSRYVVVFRDADGKQHKESARTLDEARGILSARRTDVKRGEFHEQSRVAFRDYAREWIEGYQGRRGSFRGSTREDYERALERFAIPWLGNRTLAQITPRVLSQFVTWLVDEEAQGKRAAEERRAKEAERRAVPERTLPLGDIEPVRLADSTVSNIVKPLRACLATALAEGMIRSNPARDVTLPRRERIVDDDDENVRALSRDQLSAFLAVVHPRYRLMLRFLAATGLRVSELLALQWRHLKLDGSNPCVRVRRGLVRGRFEPPKTRHGRRDVSLSADLVSALRELRKQSEFHTDDDLVFPSLTGTTPLNPENVRQRVLAPAFEEAGTPWASFHTLRHTAASLLFARGANAVQVQRFLGHHSAAFTLQTYVHLLAGDEIEPLSLDAELGGNRVATEATANDDIAREVHDADSAQ